MKPCSAPEKLIDWHEVASDLVSSLEYTYGESASAQVVIVTCVYYVGVMTAYIPRLSAMGRSPPVAAGPR